MTARNRRNLNVNGEGDSHFLLAPISISVPYASKLADRSYPDKGRLLESFFRKEKQ